MTYKNNIVMKNATLLKPFKFYNRSFLFIYTTITTYYHMLNNNNNIKTQNEITMKD